MAPLRLIKKDNQPLMLDDLLALLGPEDLNAIDAKTKTMREAFKCPFLVRNYDEFKEVLFNFFDHYHKTFYNIDTKEYIKQRAIERDGAWEQADNTHWRNYAYEFVEKHLGGQQAMSLAEKNAINGRDGGMITIIDNVTDSIIKQHTHNYIQGVFLDNISPSDFTTRCRIAQELLDRFGKLLFPGETLLPDYFLGMHLEEVITQFINQLHTIRRQWR